MTLYDLNYYYDWLIENDYFTEAELQLITKMFGFNINTLDTAVYCRYGFRTVQDFIEDID
jgi:hypothetical protein